MSVLDQTVRYWFMHHVSLADLIHSRDEIGRELLEFCETEWKQQADAAATQEPLEGSRSVH